MRKPNLLFLWVVLVICLAGCGGGVGECDDKKFECKVNGVSVDFQDSPWTVISQEITIGGHGHGEISSREEIRIVIPGKIFEATPITIPIEDYDEAKRTAGGSYTPKESGWGVVFTSDKCGGITGHITVTRLDEDRFEGTFRFRACQLNNSGAVVDVTEGRFSTCGW